MSRLIISSPFSSFSEVLSYFIIWSGFLCLLILPSSLCIFLCTSVIVFNLGEVTLCRKHPKRSRIILSQKSDLGASPSPPGSLHRLVLNSKAKANVAWLLWSSEHRGSGPSSSALGSKPAANPHQTRLLDVCVCVCVCVCDGVGAGPALGSCPLPGPGESAHYLPSIQASLGVKPALSL